MWNLQTHFPGNKHPEIFSANELENAGKDWSIDKLNEYTPGLFTVLLEAPENGLFFPPVPLKTPQGRTVFALCQSVMQFYNTLFILFVTN